jgi:hypothetical protein
MKLLIMHKKSGCAARVSYTQTGMFESDPHSECYCCAVAVLEHVAISPKPNKNKC